MRIIDSHKDYYDYLQNPTDDLVFDRRGSFYITKELLCDIFQVENYGWALTVRNSTFTHLLLQCGASFWLFLVTLETDNKKVIDYTLELLASWKDYTKPNALLKLGTVSFYPHSDRYISYDYKKKISKLDRSKINLEAIVSDFKSNNFKYLRSLNDHVVHSMGKNGLVTTNHYTIPLLTQCGIASLIAPLDLFCAIEEYFSIEKTASERTEALGATNNDKIIMHGFDTKTSFRGK